MMPDDEAISAWLDGTLDAEGDKRMTDLAAHDEAFARRVARLRHLDDLVRASVPAEDAIPDALLERLGLSVQQMPAATVVDLAEVRRERIAATAPRVVSQRSGSSLFRLAAQLALVAGVGLAVLVVSRPGEQTATPAADYRALGSVPDTSMREANALLRFAPGVAEAEAARIAAGSGLRLIGKPNQAGAWKAAAAAARRDAALQMLRSNDRVIMAEPIDGAGQ